MDALSLSSSKPDEKGLLSGQFWGELRIFAEVAKARSFNRAAERLGVSQPTISRKVRRLQDLLGAQLFVSTKQGIKLTARGDELASALLVLDQSLFSLASDLKARANDAEGLVSLSITDGLAAFFAAPAIGDFAVRFPKIQLHLKNMANLSDLRENQTDMMLSFAPSDRADVVCKALGSLHFIPMTTKGYIARYGRPTEETVSQHHFVQSHFYQADIATWHEWQAACAKGRVTHFSDNIFAYGMMVKQGLGIGLLGTYLINGSESVPLHIGVSARLPMYALALAERLDSRPVRLTFEWLCDTFAETVPWFRHDLRLSDVPEQFAAFRSLMG